LQRTPISLNSKTDWLNYTNCTYYSLSSVVKLWNTCCY